MQIEMQEIEDRRRVGPTTATSPKPGRASTPATAAAMTTPTAASASSTSTATAECIAPSVSAPATSASATSPPQPSYLTSTPPPCSSLPINPSSLPVQQQPGPQAANAAPPNSGLQLQRGFEVNPQTQSAVPAFVNSDVTQRQREGQVANPFYEILAAKQATFAAENYNWGAWALLIGAQTIFCAVLPGIASLFILIQAYTCWIAKDVSGTCRWMKRLHKWAFRSSVFCIFAFVIIFIYSIIHFVTIPRLRGYR